MATLTQREWARLPPELLELIATRITQIPDLVRFSVVCIHWRSAANSFYILLPPQFPWFILPNDEKTHSHRLFFNPADNRTRTYKTPLPKALWTRCHIDYSGASGWLLTFQDRVTLDLFASLTRSSISLPPLPLIYSMKAYWYMKAKLFGSDLFAVLFPIANAVFFCKLGDSRWRRIQGQCYLLDTHFAYHDGRFYVRHDYENISIFDPHTLKKIREVSVPSAMDSLQDYLVESPQGELLVRRKYKSKRKRFEVFRLDSCDEKIGFVELTSIVDNMLFVDGVQAMAFCVGDLKGCRGNCIYFVDHLGMKNNKGVMLFDIKKG